MVEVKRWLPKHIPLTSFDYLPGSTGTIAPICPPANNDHDTPTAP